MRKTFLAMAAIGMMGALSAPAVHSQAPTSRNSLVFKYNDDDGPGRLTITTIEGQDQGVSTIRVVLEQNNVRYQGSGISYPIQKQLPATTLYAFSITSQQRAYFFQGETISGVTLSGQGTYHRVGSPERKYKWSIVLGG